MVAPPKPPSRVDVVPFPVYASCWHGTPSLPTTRTGGVSIVAVCGGGGSAKTGVHNAIVVSVREQVRRDGDGRPGDGVVERAVRIDTGPEVGCGLAVHRHPSDVGDARLAVCAGDGVRLYAIPLEGSTLGWTDLPAAVLDDNGGDDTDGGDTDGDATRKKKRKQKPPPPRDDGPSLLLGSVEAGEGYRCAAVAFSPLGDALAVGCENGAVLVYRVRHEYGPPGDAGRGTSGDDGGVVRSWGKASFRKIVESADPHADAVFTIRFHPRSLAVLTGSKDGTIRLWDGRTGLELGRMTCELPAPDPKEEAAAARRNRMQSNRRRQPKADAVMVRGCFFGDLEGKLIYTVQSGKRTVTDLSRWVLDPAAAHKRPMPMDTNHAPPPRADFVEHTRIKAVLPRPVYSSSLSGDASVLVMGDVEGHVHIFDLELMKLTKTFPDVHDFPVTTVSARPAATCLSLPGDECGEGITFDAICSSADSRLGYLTRQRRARRRIKKSVGAATNKSGNATSDGGRAGHVNLISSAISWTVVMWSCMVLYVIFNTSRKTCRTEWKAMKDGLGGIITRGNDDVAIETHGGVTLLDRLEDAARCVWDTTIWAPPTRAGILIPPH